MKKCSDCYCTTMNRLVRARFLVAASFLLATLIQGYALFVQNDPPSPVAYFPSRYFLVSFFVMETSLQFYWIMQLFGRGLRESRTPLLPREDSGWLEVQETNTVEPAQMAFVSLYATSNFFLGAYSPRSYGHRLINIYTQWARFLPGSLDSLLYRRSGWRSAPRASSISSFLCFILLGHTQGHLKTGSRISLSRPAPVSRSCTCGGRGELSRSV
jgi:hypothetical protein